METPAVKTDFIPQKPGGGKRRKKYTGIFFTLSLIVFVFVLLGWGGMVIYEWQLEKNKTQLEQKLETQIEENVDVELIAELENLDKKINTVQDILDAHTNIALLFNFLEESTLTNSVRYNNFSYSVTEEAITVSLSGSAASFQSLGYQSQVLNEEPLVQNVAFGGFGVDEETGNVNFSLSFDIMRDFISYSQSFVENSPNAIEENTVSENRLYE